MSYSDENKLSMRLKLPVLLLSIGLCFLSSCNADQEQKAVESTAQSQSSPQEQTSAAVGQRFMSRWDALVKKDFAAAYNYESPLYREKNDLGTYIKSFSKDLTWKSVKLDKVEIEDKAKAVVKYDLAFTFKPEWGDVLESTDAHSEKWFYEAGEWWHLTEENVSPYAPVSQPVLN